MCEVWAHRLWVTAPGALLSMRCVDFLNSRGSSGPCPLFRRVFAIGLWLVSLRCVQVRWIVLLNSQPVSHYAWFAATIRTLSNVWGNSLWPGVWVWKPVFYSGLQCQWDRRWKSLSRESCWHTPEVREQQAEDRSDPEVRAFQTRCRFLQGQRFPEDGPAGQGSWKRGQETGPCSERPVFCPGREARWLTVAYTICVCECVRVVECVCVSVCSPWESTSMCVCLRERGVCLCVCFVLFFEEPSLSLIHIW